MQLSSSVQHELIHTKLARNNQTCMHPKTLLTTRSPSKIRPSETKTIPIGASSTPGALKPQAGDHSNRQEEEGIEAAGVRTFHGWSTRRASPWWRRR